MEFDSARLEMVSQRFRREMWTSVVPEAVSESGVEVERFGPVQATAFGDLPEILDLNQIQGAAEPGAIEDGHLAAAIEWMRQREVHFCVPVSEARPGAGAAHAWLGARGYEQATGWLKFIRDLSPPEFEVDHGIAIYQLGGEEIDGEALSAIIAEAMNLPAPAGTLFFSLPQQRDWRCYTAALAAGELVVSTASMMLDGDVVQLGPGNTVERARGHGCHLALLRRRLIDAAANGCRTAVVELLGCDPDNLSSAGRNLCRAGFELAYAGRVWQRPALHPAVY
ncbi:MAG TPA: hypothetical protein VMT37_08150 [Solirubrobacterales bacterium]|nr:hypothetical protein [Solirubrobacterales bacterium]